MYSLNGSEPIKNLPFRIILSSGVSRTDPSSFTDEEVLDAGYVVVDEKPQYDTATQRVSWNADTLSWDVVDIPVEEMVALENRILEEKWVEVRKTRDLMISEIMWRVQRYESHVRQGLQPVDDIKALDAYIQSLRDITEQGDPTNIVWPVQP
jgi:hypothetical protein